MNVKSVLNQLLNSQSSSSKQESNQELSLGKIKQNIPSGLLSGAAAGGLVALLASNKSARKFAKKAAAYGGTAILGGLAFKALSQWRRGQSLDENETSLERSKASHAQSISQDSTTQSNNEHHELTLIKAMIAAAKSDGHIDSEEQSKIFQAVENASISEDIKPIFFELMSRSISIDELISNQQSIEQRSEIYLIALMVIDQNQKESMAFINQLSRKLELPNDLVQQLHQDSISA